MREHQCFSVFFSFFLLNIVIIQNALQSDFYDSLAVNSRSLDHRLFSFICFFFFFSLASHSASVTIFHRTFLFINQKTKKRQSIPFVAFGGKLYFGQQPISMTKWQMGWNYRLFITILTSIKNEIFLLVSRIFGFFTLNFCTRPTSTNSKTNKLTGNKKGTFWIHEIRKRCGILMKLRIKERRP